MAVWDGGLDALVIKRGVCLAAELRWSKSKLRLGPDLTDGLDVSSFNPEPENKYRGTPKVIQEPAGMRRSSQMDLEMKLCLRNLA